MIECQTSQVERCLARLRSGDSAAREELVGIAIQRFHLLARKMLKEFPTVGRLEESTAVLDSAMMKLHRELAKEVPGSVRLFLWRTAKYVRQALINLARRHNGVTARPFPSGESDAAADTSRPRWEPADDTHEPSRLAAWSQFHALVETFPDDEREVFDLLWYQDLTQEEAAALIGVDRRTVIRRWQRARLRLAELLRNRGLDSLLGDADGRG